MTKTGVTIMVATLNKKIDINEAGEWYDENKSKNEKFCIKMQELIKESILSEDVHIHSVTGRLKEKDSFLKKCKSEKYDRIEQIKDVIGVRVITFIKDDVKKVFDLIKEWFNIIEDKDENKTGQLKDNEVGYRSDHYLLSVNLEKCKFPGYEHFADKVFEIQIRTLLQHAWAEIEHDRGYKFEGKYPSDIKREFYLIAGTLELMDMEF
jgi:ppGpp synthetase/RelA/SpoT-type nucleotidyltranferase